MNTKYGSFSEEQFAEYKVVLHKKLFWLLLYKDPKTKDNYSHIDFNKYFDSLMYKINGMNSLLQYPECLVEIMGNLEAARIEANKEMFDYSVYRKLVLDAHALIDRI